MSLLRSPAATVSATRTASRSGPVMVRVMPQAQTIPMPIASRPSATSIMRLLW